MSRSFVLDIITLMSCLPLAPDPVCGETIWSFNKLYEVVIPRVKYSTAESHCEAKGGHLAKLSLTILKADELLSHFLYNARTGCAWIGMTDRGKEGDWRWFDGTAVVDVRWEEMSAFLRFVQAWYWDCGKLCERSVGFDGFEWEWQQTPCNSASSFVCEYDGPEQGTMTIDGLPNSSPEVVTTVPLPHSTPEVVTTVPLPRPKRKPKAGVGVPVVIQKSKGYISGEPLSLVRCSVVTMCARACEKKKGCNLFNYNNVTKRCRLFSAVEDSLVETDEMWTIWGLIARSR